MENVVPITINREGEWYYGDNKMFRLDIVSLLAEHLEKDRQGNYYIHYNNQVYPVNVEATPFVAQSLQTITAEQLTVKLTDGRMVDIKLDTLILDNGIPYATMKWPQDTRLSRQVLWDLGDYLVEDDNSVYLQIDGKTHQLNER